MELSAKHHEYWRKNLVITAILLVIWFVVTFVEAWYARELNSYTFLGFPLGFYMSAQGSLIIYVVIIWFYARYMNKLDDRIRRRRGRQTNEPGRVQPAVASSRQLKKYYTLLHRRLPRLPGRARDRRADGPVARSTSATRSCSPRSPSMPASAS